MAASPASPEQLDELGLTHVFSVTGPRFKGHSKYVSALIVEWGKGDAEYLFTGSGDLSARQWDARTGTEVMRFVGHTCPVLCVVVDSVHKHVFTGSLDRSARMWDLTSGKELSQFGHEGSAHAGGVRCCGVDSSGQSLYTGGGMESCGAGRW